MRANQQFAQRKNKKKFKSTVKRKSKMIGTSPANSICKSSELIS